MWYLPFPCLLGMYFVGWLLEVTTHIKYWDYSSHRFNLHGRISLFICLWWGVLSYLTIFYVHPAVEKLFSHFSVLPRQIVALLLLLITLTDAAATIRNLALTAKLIRKLEQAGDELALQMSLAKAEMLDRLSEMKDDLGDRLIDARADFDHALEEARQGQRQSLLSFQEKQPQLWARYEQLQEKAERYTRHLRHTYRKMSSSRYAHSLEQLKLNSELVRQKARLRRQLQKEAKKKAKEKEPRQ